MDRKPAQDVPPQRRRRCILDTLYARPRLLERGEYEIALDYYSAAVRSFPQRFATMGALDAYTHNWKPRERVAILEVAGAWKADSKRSDADVDVHRGYGIAPASTPRQ